MTDLTNDTLYAFQLRARRANAIGPHAGNPTANPAALTAKPTGLAAVSGENTAATLKWPTTNSATSWQYTKDDGTTWTAMTPTDVKTVGSNHTFKVTGLTNGTEYTFKIRGLNRNGDTGETATSAAVTATPRLLPAPTGLAATPADSSFTATWTDPDDETIVKYQYQVTLKDATLDATKWYDVPVSTDKTVTHTVTQLDNATDYDYHLRAVSAVQTGVAAKITVTPHSTPAAPANLAAAIGDQQITLTWDDFHQRHHHPLAAPPQDNLRFLAHHRPQRLGPTSP